MLFFDSDLIALQIENFNKAKIAMSEMHAYVREKISTLKEKSVKSGKPLLILMGERHNSFFSSLSEIVAMTAAIENGIRCFFREEDDTRNQAINECVKYYISGGTELKPWSRGRAAVYTRLFLHTLTLEFQMADQGANDCQLIPYKEKSVPKEGTPTNEAGIKYRNEVMSDIFNKQNGMQDILAIVGSLHLKGLASEEHLEDLYEVLVFNSAEDDENYPKESYFYDCMDFNKKLDNLMRLFYKDKEWIIAALPDSADNYFFDLFMNKSKNALQPIWKVLRSPSNCMSLK